MRARLLTLRMPLDQIALLSFTSTRTSEVFMTFCANFFTCWVQREGRDGSVGVLGKEKSLGLKGEAGPGHHGGRKRLIRRRCGDSIDTNGVARTPSERVRSSAASSTPIGGRHARRRRASRATPTPSPNRGSNRFFGMARTACTARGALFLKVSPWTALARLMVYSRVTTS